MEDKECRHGNPKGWCDWCDFGVPEPPAHLQIAIAILIDLGNGEPQRRGIKAFAVREEAWRWLNDLAAKNYNEDFLATLNGQDLLSTEQAAEDFSYTLEMIEVVPVGGTPHDRD